MTFARWPPTQSLRRLVGGLGVATAAATAGAAGCETPLPVAEPTWADVEPLLRAHCNHCHGSTADRTGSSAGTTYRFDFYDADPRICGEATQGMGAAGAMNLARSWAPLIKASVTPKTGGRARMPPAPARALERWERETLVRWVDQQARRGAAPEDNQPPTIQVETARSMSTPSRLSVRALVQDADGQAVVGLLRIGELELKMNRAGSFSTTVDTAGWARGTHPISAVLCDGWTQSRLQLGTVPIGDPDAGGRDGAAVADGAEGGPADGLVAVDAMGRDAGQADGSTVTPEGGGAIPDAGSEVPAVMGRCPDLDGNGILDCDETLLVNATFDEDLRGWSLEFNAGMAFTRTEVGGRPASGAVAITNVTAAEDDGVGLAGARQCLKVTPGARYRLFAEVLIPGGQDGEASDPLRAAGLNALFWSSPDCLGEVVGAFTPPLVSGSQQDQWRVTSGVTNAPTTARSMAVRLVAAKSFRQPPFRVLIDNVLVKSD